MALALAPLRYTVDLQHLQTLCALNYGRLRRLLPGLERDHYRFPP